MNGGRSRTRIMTTLAMATVALFVAAGGLAFAAAGAEEATAVVKKFVDDFNKGDIKGAEAAHASKVAIIDEFPPHAWHGGSAFKDWLADLEKDAKAHEQTDQKLAISRTVRAQVDGDTAYVVMAATFTYKEKGKKMVEPGQMAIALSKDGGAWKIVSWAWAGTTPHS